MKNANTKNEVIRTKNMGSAVQSYISAIEQANVSKDAAYASLRKAVRDGIASGIKGNKLAYAEYRRRVTYCADKIFASGVSTASTAKTIADTLIRGMKADGWTPPAQVLDDSEKAEKARAIAANVKAKQRALTKIKAELKKAEAGRKWREGELAELAEVRYAEQRDETKDQKAQQKAVASKLEGTTGFNVLAFPKEVKDGKYSDGALPRSLAAFAAFIQTFKEETAE
jgi:hypothetical protein